MKLDGIEYWSSPKCLVLAFYEGKHFLAESQVRTKSRQHFVGIYWTTGELAGGRDWLIDCRACSA